MRIAVVALALAAAGAARSQTIEMRKVGALVDRDGKGFTRAPMSIVPIGKWFAMTEMNELPLVVDSSGRLIRRFPKGEGPGEFEANAFPARIGRGDTLYVGNHTNINVFDRDLKFVRRITQDGSYIGNFIPIDGQFVISSGRPGPANSWVSIHVLDANGTIVRSFLTDTLGRPRPRQSPQYTIGRGEGKTIWAWPHVSRRLQRWTLDGIPGLIIDTTPPWFPQADPLYKSTIRSVQETNGILWVFSSVPVPNARAMSEAAFKGKGEADARAFPFEQEATAWLEAFDARTGKRLAELHLKKFGVGFVDDHHFMIYTTSADDTAQLEIWEMKLKR